MATGTYDEARWSARDELRAMLSDIDVDPGTTTLSQAIFSDTVYDNVLSAKGNREGAAHMATMYANFYVNEAKKFANTQEGTSVEFENRAAEYRRLAADFRAGRISLGDSAVSESARGMQIGTMTAGLGNAQFHEATGFYPIPDVRDP